MKIHTSRTTTTDHITYSADGHVLEVLGENEWKFVYDENGNIISIMDKGRKLTLGYDSGDRVVQVGETQTLNCIFDIIFRCLW